jgi:hypothetical protein
LSRTPDTDWRVHLEVEHPAPTFKEPQVLRERRVLQYLRAFLDVNRAELREQEARKIEKVINTRMLNILNEARPDAETKP